MLHSVQKHTKADLAWTRSCCHHSNQSRWCKNIRKAATVQLWKLVMPKLGLFFFFFSHTRISPLHFHVLQHFSCFFTTSQTVELAADFGFLFFFLFFVYFRNATDGYLTPRCCLYVRYSFQSQMSLNNFNIPSFTVELKNIHNLFQLDF